MEMQLSQASWPLLLVLLLPLVCLLYLRQDHNRKQQPRASDGDLKAYPIVGRFPHLAKNGHRLVEWSVEVAKRSPTQTTTFKAPGLPGLVITANPDNVEHIAKTSFANYPIFFQEWIKISLLQIKRGYYSSNPPLEKHF